MNLPDDPRELKGLGILQQKEAGLFTVRLCATGGEWSAEQLQAAADLARTHGCGLLHLTVRQGIEIPDVPRENLRSLVEGLSQAGLAFGGTGPRVRGIVACPGGRCRRGLIDSAATARALAEAVGHRSDLPHKFKISVTGCPSRCAKPEENDLGVQGLPGGGYQVYVGGRMGRNPSLGKPLEVKIRDLSELQAVAGACIDWFCKHAQGKQRFGAVIDEAGAASLCRAAREAIGQG
jgi:dissimilatory sulfite reductase (desulfoviridin) alpha/beta subunit